MGVLDFPGRLYAIVDRGLATGLPPSGRLVCWAVLGGVISMAVYWGLSPQTKIAAAKAQAAEARRQLNAYTGDFASAGPLIRAQLRAAVWHVALVLPATLVASLPVLSLLVWLETSYGYDFPHADEMPTVEVVPASFQGRWRDGPDGPHVEISTKDGRPVSEIAIEAPIPHIEKQRWWNVLVGNPVGYLPASGRVESVTIALPAKRYLTVGPAWARSWLAIFLPALMLTSLAVYRIGRIE